MTTGRAELFSAGVAALARVWSVPAHQEGLYACPTCLVMNSVDDDGPNELTVDHVPPRVLKGSSLVVLTCKNCNNTAGRLLDNEIKKRRVVESLEPDRPVRGRLTVGDLTINAVFAVRPDGRKLEVDSRYNKPGTTKTFIAAVEANGGRMSFTAAGYHRRREAVGLLRVAYLATFAVFGYSCILSPVYDKIREQIANPDAEILPHAWRNRNRARDSARRIWFVVEPITCLGVQIDETMVLLPVHPIDNLYEELDRTGEAPLQSKGEPILFPRTPLYRFDNGEHFKRGSVKN